MYDSTLMITQSSSYFYHWLLLLLTHVWFYFHDNKLSNLLLSLITTYKSYLFQYNSPNNYNQKCLQALLYFSCFISIHASIKWATYTLNWTLKIHSLWFNPNLKVGLKILTTTMYTFDKRNWALSKFLPLSGNKSIAFLY